MEKLLDGHVRTVAIDLDGTLAEYESGWQGWRVIGAPRLGAREALAAFHVGGWRVIVHTTRADLNGVWVWLEEHDLARLVDHINYNPANGELRCSPGKPLADLYIDDRAWPLCGKPVPWAEVIEDLRKRGWL